MERGRIETTADLYQRFRERQSNDSMASVVPEVGGTGFIPVNIEIYPNGKIEAFIVMETVSEFKCFRVVGSPERISEIRKEHEDLGIYENVIITVRTSL